jgi:hypothetical protein
MGDFVTGRIWPCRTDPGADVPGQVTGFGVDDRRDLP